MNRRCAWPARNATNIWTAFAKEILRRGKPDYSDIATKTDGTFALQEFTVPVPNSPHGINTAPDGIHFVANGKLSPTVTIFDARKLPDLFDDKIKPRDVVVAEPELGLGPLHTAYDGKGNAFTTLFLDS